MSTVWSNQLSMTASVPGSVASTNTEGLSPITSPCSTHVADSSASERERSLSGMMETDSTGSHGRYRYWGSLLPNSAGGLDCKVTKHATKEGKSAVCAETTRSPRAVKPKQRKIFGTLRHLLPSSSPASAPNTSESQPRLSRTRPRISRRLVHFPVDPSFDGSSASQPCSDRVENFHHALDNPLVDQHLRAFCKRTLSSENVAFVRQVREMENLCATEGESRGALQQRLALIANNFLRPGCAAEVNVKGCTRRVALDAIFLAEQGCGDTGVTAGDGVACEREKETILAATAALVDVAREVHLVILHDLWPRFLASPEFAILMLTKEMREVGFRNLDGSICVPRSAASLLSRRSQARRRERNDNGGGVDGSSTADPTLSSESQRKTPQPGVVGPNAPCCPPNSPDEPRNEDRRDGDGDGDKGNRSSSNREVVPNSSAREKSDFGAAGLGLSSDPNLTEHQRLKHQILSLNIPTDSTSENSKQKMKKLFPTSSELLSGQFGMQPRASLDRAIGMSLEHLAGAADGGRGLLDVSVISRYFAIGGIGGHGVGSLSRSWNTGRSAHSDRGTDGWAGETRESKDESQADDAPGCHADISDGVLHESVGKSHSQALVASKTGGYGGER